MRLITFQASGGAPELGAVVADGRIAPISRAGLPSDMIELIARWPELKADAQAAAGRMETLLAADSVTWLAPIPRPGKIMAIGLNYADHIAETGAGDAGAADLVLQGRHRRARPVRRRRSSRRPPTASTTRPSWSRSSGSAAATSPARRRPARVFGYCAGNDVTVRDWQMRTRQWVLGKSFDTHAPFGPWITTADEVARSARAADPLPCQRREAAGARNTAPPGLRRLGADRAPVAGDDAGARRPDLHRHARRRRRGDAPAAVPEGRRCGARRDRRRSARSRTPSGPRPEPRTALRAAVLDQRLALDAADGAVVQRADLAAVEARAAVVGDRRHIGAGEPLVGRHRRADRRRVGPGPRQRVGLRRRQRAEAVLRLADVAAGVPRRRREAGARLVVSAASRSAAMRR